MNTASEGGQSDSEEESESVIGREVQATMAIGGALGINFLPNSSEVLRTMIQLEAQEYSQALEREAGR